MTAQAQQGQAASEEAITLTLEHDENGQSAAYIQVKWTISPDTARYLQEHASSNPDMLLVITNGGVDMGRYVVPLKDGTTWVEFLRPGDNVIRGTVVWRFRGVKKSPKQVLEARDDEGHHKAGVLETFQPRVDELRAEIAQLDTARWSINMAEEGGEQAYADLTNQLSAAYAAVCEAEANAPERVKILSSFSSIERITAEAQCTVNVPKEMFAGPPWPTTRWLNRRYPSLWSLIPGNGCNRRKRATFVAFTLWIYAGVAVAREAAYLLITGALLFCGVRGLGFSPFRHPFSGPRAIIEDAESSVWWYKKVHLTDGEHTLMTAHYDLRHPVFWVVNPPAVLAAVFVGFTLNLFLSLALATTAVLLGVALIALIVSGLATLKRRRIQKRYQAQAASAQRLRQSRPEALSPELQRLVDGKEGRGAPLRVILVWCRIKSGVCRPIAR